MKSENKGITADN